MCSKFWSCYNKKQGDTNESKTIQLNQCFENRKEEDKIYPLTVKDIFEAQRADNTLKQFFKSNAVLDYGLELLHRKRKLHMPQGTAPNTKALAKSCSYVVPSLSSAP